MTPAEFQEARRSLNDAVRDFAAAAERYIEATVKDAPSENRKALLVHLLGKYEQHGSSDVEALANKCLRDAIRIQLFKL